MSAKIPFSEYVHTATYPYTTPDGDVIFEKRRYEHLDPISGARSKTFRYWDPETRGYRKPGAADPLIYRLPDVRSAIASRRVIHWTEGEKDADALVAAGEVATSHHQGACHVVLQQAEWLTNAALIVLWIDRDPVHPEIGAYDAALRYNLLLDARVPAELIDFVWARTGKDAFDHLGKYGPDEALLVEPRQVEALARAYSPSALKRAGYHNGR